MLRLNLKGLTKSFPPSSPIYASDSLNPFLKDKLLKIDVNQKLVAQKNLDPSSISMLFRIKLGFHSNAIEGNSLSEKQIIDFIQNGITIGGKPFRDFLDVYHHDMALRYVLESTSLANTLTPEDVKKVHSIALPTGFSKDDPV